MYRGPVEVWQIFIVINQVLCHLYKQLTDIQF